MAIQSKMLRPIAAPFFTNFVIDDATVLIFEDLHAALKCSAKIQPAKTGMSALLERDLIAHQKKINELCWRALNRSEMIKNN